MDAVTIVDVGFSYGSRQVIDGLFLTLEAGTLTAVKGANGSGKSTLLALIAGTLRPSRGVVSLASQQRPAVVLQRSKVSDALPLTVRQTVAMGCWGNRSWLKPLGRGEHAVVVDSLERVGLLALAHRQLGELSGGQRQRVLLAQGIAQQSRLLLLDEPVAGVDEQSRARIRQIIATEVHRGVTVVEVTHSHADASEADRVLVMAQGGIVADSQVLCAAAASEWMGGN
ncbi:zinc ABC transporter ATP-binding protein AztA [Arthrobacter antibioticus]|uniref:zinc ABC transporter ATP-binding protein AztA n=1 Tax=Arthrobacter sp. H35-MC1 TaxID=3046203 RepID=UPI0024BA7571|nr:zinc ABC transporter ATP-binding protein AztA [Arthrobacter sp. H35-MC1]MDJ0318030.1 zinc ABC transporter ATP-binding protein AztA [Arthrobacter sp. H35-MC1]